MQIPRIWEKQTVEGVDPRGHKVTAAGWGWSESNSDEARRRATESARRVLNWLLDAYRGGSSHPPPHHYGYDERLPREEIIEEYHDDAGQPQAFISRNAYGALILNTRDLAFIDIDLPPQPRTSPLGWLARLFGKPPSSPVDRTQVMLEEIRDTARRFSEFGFRVYRTLNGFRVMVSNQRMLPDSPRSQALLADFDTDPLYVRMCKNQQCFRARLTPKAWRCKIPMPPARFPFDNPDIESQYRHWEQVYNDKTRTFSTCNFVEQLGPDVIGPGLLDLIEIHDQLTKATADQPLA